MQWPAPKGSMAACSAGQIAWRHCTQIKDFFFLASAMFLFAIEKSGHPSQEVDLVGEDFAYVITIEIIILINFTNSYAHAIMIATLVIHLSLQEPES
jgi:hypothetical protein